MATSFGGTVKLQGETEYRRALNQITQNLREVSSEMKVVSTSFDKNDKSTSAVAAKSQVLNKQLDQQKEKLIVLKSRYDELSKTEDENSVSMSRLRIQINQAQADCNKTANAIDQLGKESEETGKQVEKSSDGFTVFKGVLANLSTQVINAAINGLKKLGSTLISVGKQALESYADYEQLVGGVETLFKDSAEEVKKYAEGAYKTAGMSANEYMETVTSFSASLLQGLGGDTAKAAKVADMAISDMSDNANKMGTSIEMIQNAYQGFAKQNYSMLDNLKLGYGGSATEMARLVNESGVLQGSMKVTAQTVKDVPFDKMIEAIHKVQDQMGITGTTAKEASSTISGSIASAKSAWQNLLTGIADGNQDIGELAKNFADSAVTVLRNIIPRIKEIVKGMGKLFNTFVKETIPAVLKELPPSIQKKVQEVADKFQWFVKHKGAIVGALKAIVLAFAVSKVYQWSKGINDAIMGFGNLIKNVKLATVQVQTNTTAQGANTAAQIAGTTATSGLTVATQALNAAFKANPIGLIITGITTLIGVFGLFKSSNDEATKSISEQTQKLNDQIDSWNDLKDAQQKEVDAGMTNMSYYENLYSELQNITDENGKVKDGYEKRADFILTTLNEALGTEYTMTGNVIDQYTKLKDGIQEVIDKKKANIILQSQEAAYQEAINNQAAGYSNLIDLKGQLEDKTNQEIALEQEIQALKDSTATKSTMENNIIFSKIEAKQKELDKLKEETATKQAEYDAQQNLLSEYAFNIGQYETNMALAHEGKYAEMSRVNWEMVKDLGNAQDAQKTLLEQQIATETEHYNHLLQLKEQSGSDMYDSQINASKKLLDNYNSEMEKYKQVTATKLSEDTNQWLKDMSNQISLITLKQVEFKDAGGGNVQMYVDGVAEGKQTTVDTMKDIIEADLGTVTGMKPDFDTAGQDLLQGIDNGINNQDKRNTVFRSISNFGAQLLAKLRASLEEHSPSKAGKQAGAYLLEGVGIGIKDEEKSVYKEIDSFGNEVKKSLNNALSMNLNTNLNSALRGSYKLKPQAVTNQNQDNTKSTIEAFKTALSQMEIRLDSEKMGEFVDMTVSNAIYN